MNLKYSILLAALYSFIYINSGAQVWPGPHPLLSSWYKINAGYHAPSQVDTFENKFGYYRGEGAFNIPLYRGKDWLTATGNTPLIGVTLQGAASYMQPQGDFLNNDMQLLRFRLGGNFIYSKGLRNLFMVNVQGVDAHSSRDFNFSDIYINGSGFWRHRKNDQLSYTLGLCYSSMFGDNRLLPLLGVSYRPLKEDLITLMFPAYFQYTHFFSKRTAAGFAVRPFSGLYNISYLINDTALISDQKFTHREWQIAARLKVKISYQLSIEPEAGYASGVKLSIAENDFKSSASLYAAVMIRYKFGERAHVAPILDFDPADFVNADPEVPEN
jgi:hypothetical protein